MRKLASAVAVVLAGITVGFGAHATTTARADCCDYSDVQDGNTQTNASGLSYSFTDCEQDEYGNPYCVGQGFGATAELGIYYSIINDYDYGNYWVDINQDWITLDVSHGNDPGYNLTVTPEPFDEHWEWFDYQKYATQSNNVGIQNSCPYGCAYNSYDAVASGNANDSEAYWDPGAYQDDTVVPNDNAWSPPAEVDQFYGFNGDIGNQP